MSTLAILGGPKTRETPYPTWPVQAERESELLDRVLQSAQWGGFPYPGPQTAEFVQRFLEIQGGKHGVAVSNGTQTMEVALRAAGIGWGDEVIVPAYTFQATASAPITAGAIPVIVDIDPETFCIDPKAVEAAITDKTRAIIPVHLGDQVADMDAIMKIADKHNLIVIEDCAHAHGAQWNGRGIGTIGHFGSFSMQSAKLLTSGEGGLLICNTEEMAYRATSIIDFGRAHDPDGQMITFGTNYRMSEFQSAVLNGAMDAFHDQMRERADNATYMDEAVSEVKGVRSLKRDPRHTRRTYYRYGLKIDPDLFGGASNHVVCAALKIEGIPAWQGYEPMHQNPTFKPQLSKMPVPVAFPQYFDFDNMSFPQAERAYHREGLWFAENTFRAGHDGIDDAVAALTKIQNFLSGNPGAIDEIKAIAKIK